MSENTGNQTNDTEEKQIIDTVLKTCSSKWVSDMTGVNIMDMLEKLVLNSVPEGYIFTDGYHFVSTIRPRGLFIVCGEKSFHAKLIYDYNVVVEISVSDGVVKSVKVRTIEDLIPCC